MFYIKSRGSIELKSLIRHCLHIKYFSRGCGASLSKPEEFLATTLTVNGCQHCHEHFAAFYSIAFPGTGWDMNTAQSQNSK